MLRSAYLLPGRVIVQLHLSKKWFSLHQKFFAGVQNMSVSHKLFANNVHNEDNASRLESEEPAQTRHGPEDSQSGDEDHRYEQNVKDKILAASLPFVHMHGWTRHALSAGAESVGYAGVAHGLFPKDGAELVQYFCTLCNAQLAERLKKDTEQEGYKQKETQVFIRDAVEMRLRMIIPYVDRWPQALAIQSLPPNVPESLASLLTLVDDIWFYAGDKSADFNWYSRRVGLAGLYKVSELYLIQDKSEDFRSTWHFLSRRLDDVAYLNSYVQQTREASQMAKEAATAAFITARNILGLSFGNR